MGSAAGDFMERGTGLGADDIGMTDIIHTFARVVGIIETSVRDPKQVHRFTLPSYTSLPVISVLRWANSLTLKQTMSLCKLTLLSATYRFILR